MTEDGFRLPDSSYDQLTKIIMAYEAFPQPAAPSDVSRAIDIHETTISRNGAFLVGIGVLEGKRTKILTKAGRDLARALQLEMPDEIRHNWRSILQENDFVLKVLSAVRIRKGMERSALQTHIAYSAGQSKSDLVLRGANAVIDILRAAEFLKEADGKLVAVTEEAQRTPDGLNVQTDETDTPTLESPSQNAVNATALATGISQARTGSHHPLLSIQIQIRCDASEIEDLGHKIQKLLRDLGDSTISIEADVDGSHVSDDTLLNT